MLKLSFAVSSVFLSGLSYAGCLDGNNYLWKSNGKLQQLSFYEALNACPSGKHLPTARELAELSQTNGAKGIMEIDAAKSLGADPEAPPRQGSNLSFYQKTGYDLIDTFVPHSNGIRDRFYFNPSGYKQPDSIGCSGGQGIWSWSASLYVYYPDGYSYQFEGENGSLVPWNTYTQNNSNDNKRMVMCFPN
ncbi:MAG: hypothetical protein NDJ89_18080 [Oligoflexia bacterium]|nr:hypothetical protein [Oligoflexia bacterium]